MAGLRWHDWLLSVGQNGCFYSSANTDLSSDAFILREPYRPLLAAWAATTAGAAGRPGRERMKQHVDLPTPRSLHRDLRVEWDVALFGARCDLGL